MGDSQYSFSLTTFSPSGKLVQIEHALTAVGSGQTSLGIKAANGVVIATEKKLPSILVDETSVQKIQSLTPNIGVVYSGMGPDFRVLVRKSRKQAQQYYRLYKETIPVTQLVRETAAVMQEFTQSGGVRPFGVSLLIAGYDDNGPQLYQVDPSGSYFSWKASAMGKNVSNAKTYTEDMELDDAIHTAILTLKEGYEGQISANNIEIGVIRSDREFKVLTPAEIKDFLEEVEVEDRKSRYSVVHSSSSNQSVAAAAAAGVAVAFTLYNPAPHQKHSSRMGLCSPSTPRQLLSTVALFAFGAGLLAYGVHLSYAHVEPQRARTLARDQFVRDYLKRKYDK
uniref:Proteasome subunit alpha type-2 n=1 Tax=Oryza meridionalis TaxID=40149 RepID=A0A0E0CNV0_9ORYZ